MLSHRPMTRPAFAWITCSLVVAVSSAQPAPSDPEQTVEPFDSATVQLHYYAGEHQAEMVFTAETEEPIVSARITGPRGLVHRCGRGPRKLGRGGSQISGGDLRFKTVGRDPAWVAATFPPGDYMFRAVREDGTVLRSAVYFNDRLPAPPVVLEPRGPQGQHGQLRVNAIQQSATSDLTVAWLSPTDAPQIEVSVERESPDDDDAEDEDGDGEVIRVKIPRGTQQFSVPAELLTAGTYSIDVSAIHVNGNRSTTQLWVQRRP